MNKLFHKIVNVVQKDVSSESESNDLAILIRTLSLLGVIYNLVAAIVLAFCAYSYTCLMLIFCIGVMFAAFMCTYEGKTLLGMRIYITTTLLISSVLSITVGWKYMFVPMVFVTTMLMFFSLKISILHKLQYAGFAAVYLFVTAAISSSIPLRTALPSAVEFLLLIVNLCLCSASFTVVAYAFCTKYTKSEEKILQYNKKLEQMVSTDALTSLWNRRAMNEHLSLLTSEYLKHKKEFSLAILDIDFFKRVNDEYGHGMGDYVLKSLSYLLKTYMEGKGHVARWGGEEFLLTFEDMDFEHATKALNLLRERISSQDFSFKDVTLHLTITGGIEEYNSNFSIDLLITRADEKLYKGKTSGRNKIVS